VSESRPSPEASNPRAAAIPIVLAVFFDLVGFAIVVPQLPLAASRYTASGLVIGLVVATDSLFCFLLAPRWGRLSDRIGRRPVLLIGLAGSATAYVVYGLAGSLAVLVLSRVLSGSLVATVNVAQAALADITPPAQRARAMGLVGAAFGLAFTIGPALGGIASRWGEAAPGLLAAGVCGANLLLSSVTLRESRTRAAQAWGATTRVARPALVVTFLATLAFTTMYVVFQQFGSTTLGLSRAGISYAFTLVGVVSVIVQGRLIRRLAPRVGELRLAAWGAAIMAAGLVLLPLLGTLPRHTWPQIVGLVAAVALLSAGFSFVGPCVTGWVSREVNADDQGRAMGTLQSIGAGARIVGPPVLGLLGQWGGHAAAFLVAAIAAATASVVAGAWRTGGARERAGRFDRSTAGESGSPR
jgi:MFS family permease